MKRLALGLLLMLGFMLLLITCVSAQTGEELKLKLSFDNDPVDISKGESITVIPTVVGGVAPYDFQIFWFNDEYGGGLHSLPSEESAPETFRPKFGKTGRVEVEVTDMNYKRATESLLFTIIGAPDLAPLTIDASLDKEEVQLEDKETVTASWIITGGRPPYVCSYHWWNMLEEGDPEAYGEISVLEPGQLKSVEVLPTWPGGYYSSFSLGVADADGRSTSVEKNIFVFGEIPEHIDEPFAFKSTLDKSSVDVLKGETLTITVEPRGGVPPYTYDYEMIIFDKGVTLLPEETVIGSSSNQFTFKPKLGQRGYIGVSVHDQETTAIHGDSTNYFSITGAPDEPPFVNRAKVTHTPPDLSKGDGVTIEWITAGGTPPYVYRWYISVHTEDFSDLYYSSGPSGSFSATSNRVTIYPPKPGKGQYSIYAKDSRGRIVYDGLNESFEIIGVPSVTPGDADGDGKITMEDLMSIIEKLLNKGEPNHGANADANQDGVITVDDAVWLIQQFVN